jgi:predicted DNA-binding transcriptional regulator AlpA
VDADSYPDGVVSAIAEAQRNELADAARAAIAQADYLGSLDLEQLTGIPASTWRYWASIGSGPASFKMGRRRVWRKSAVLAWIAEQETASS